MDATTVQIPALKSLGGGRAMAIIVGLTLAASALIFALIKMKPAVPEGSNYSAIVAAVPAVNAFFNAVAAAFMTAAFVAVRKKQYNRHAALMTAALGASVLFLVGYLVYHAAAVEQRFQGQGPVRPLYFFILITHVVRAPICLLMVLTSLWLSLSGRLAAHRRVSRWTLPIWLYVSVTGVAIFFFLKIFNSPPQAV
jgi:putative membrane protein